MTTKPILRWSGVLALGLLMACSDDGEGGTEQSSSSSSTDASTTAPGTTDPLPSTGTTTALDGSSGSTDGSTGPLPTSSETGSSSGLDSGSSSGESSGSGSGSESSSSGDPTGGGMGYCMQTCAAPIDCAFGGDPADWACNGGFCEYVAHCDPITCDDLGLGLFCSEYNGVSTCLIGCMNDTDCAFFGDLTCTGVDDFGQSFCESAPCAGKAMGDPCFFGSPDQYGVCDGDSCICTDDSQCTATDFACNN